MAWLPPDVPTDKLVDFCAHHGFECKCSRLMICYGCIITRLTSEVLRLRQEADKLSEGGDATDP